jgi:hypothetical protein
VSARHPRRKTIATSRRTVFCLALALLVGCRASMSRPVPELPPPRTVAESSGGLATSSHADVMSFLDAVRAAGDERVVRSRFGTTPGGRELPLVIVADPPVRDARAARESGRPRVLVMGNIHAGEVEGKEAVQELLREVVWSGDGLQPYPVHELIVLFAPIYNADGNDAFGPNNRPMQNGPTRTGRRETDAGLDLNRDYMKQEAAEARALVAMIEAWDPHVVVDLHTTNGSAHGYELTYSPPLTPSAHPDLLALLEDDWLPTLRRRVRDEHGYELFDYGNFETAETWAADVPDPERGWRTFDHRPRFGNNYVGLRNRLAILSEAYSYLGFEQRIAVTRAFVTEILKLTAERGDVVIALCRRMDEETAALAARRELSLATRAEMVPRGSPEPVLLRDARLVTEAVTGRTVKVSDGPRRAMDLSCFVRFEATETAMAPSAYLLPPTTGVDGDDIAALLENHGIRFERLDASRSERVEVYTVASTSLAERAFQGHRVRETAWRTGREGREFPVGTLLVPTDQPLARVVFHLLDPRADDGLVVWNAFDAALMGPGAELPVYLLR